MKKLRFFKNTAVLGLSALMLAAFAFTAAAASNKTNIDNVTLSFDTSSIEIGSSEKRIEVTSGNEAAYTVSNDQATATNMDGDKWHSGITPKFNITIKAEEGYKFDTSALKNSTYFTLKGGNVSFVRARGGSNSITLTVKMPKLRGSTENLGVDDLNWDEYTGKASWSPADVVEKYTVKLYRGSSLVTQIETTGTSYNFSSEIGQRGKGNYTFKVRASAWGTHGEWNVSDDLYVGDEEISRFGNGNGTPGGSSKVNGAWLKDGKGWWYSRSDRSYPKSQWELINNKWYYFNSEGYMMTGWIKTNSKWYYCDKGNGAMLANTTTPDGYRVDSNGAWIQ